MRLLPAASGALAALLLLSAGWAVAQTFGEHVSVTEPADRDLYLAGRLVDLLAPAAGDVVAAGQRIVVHDRVGQDLNAAGETVLVQGAVGDDVRAAGREVRIDGPVGDHVVVAGETVSLGPAATVGGWLWSAGGHVRLAGAVAGDVRVVADAVVVSGTVAGNLRIRASTIELAPGARIGGDLIWTAPDRPRVAPGADIGGRVVERPGAAPGPAPREEAGWLAGLFLAASLAVAGAAGFLLFPGFSRAVAASAWGERWKSLGLGLAALTATPLVAVLLLASGVGALLGLTVLALYLVALLAGLLAGVFALGQGVLERWRPGAGRAARIGAFVAALLVLGLVRQVPVAGPLALFVVLLAGLGALNLQTHRAYTGGPPAARNPSANTASNGRQP